jgi:hypothetical protein
MLSVKGENDREAEGEKAAKRKKKGITPLFLLDVWANKW